MEPTDLRDGHHSPERRRLHLAWPWTVVFERLMGTYRVVVSEVGTQEPAEMSLAQNEEVIQAFSADGADHPLHKRVLQSRQLQLIR